MRALELSPRLRAIAGQVPEGAKLADIGTDHACLPVSLLLSGRIREAAATDINEGPLMRGRETARTWGVEDRIAFFRRDGLQGLEAYGPDTIVIAGMGGDLIAGILGAAAWTRNDVLLLLQPMTAQPVLRRWLNGNGYRILRETVVREGEKLYVVLTAAGGEEPPYTPAELWAGRQCPSSRDPYRLFYLEDLIRRRRRALAGMSRSSSLPADRLERERGLLKDLESMREEWIAWQR